MLVHTLKCRCDCKLRSFEICIHIKSINFFSLFLSPTLFAAFPVMNVIVAFANHSSIYFRVGQNEICGVNAVLSLWHRVELYLAGRETKLLRDASQWVVGKC